MDKKAKKIQTFSVKNISLLFLKSVKSFFCGFSLPFTLDNPLHVIEDEAFLLRNFPN
jgi:hypothetical protein